MKRSRFTEKQIIGILKEHQVGLSATDLCRKHGISDATFYNWRSKYGGMDVSDAKKLKALEAENAKLKKLLAESVMDVSTLKEILGKKLLPPGSTRSAVYWAIDDKGYSQRRACSLVGLDRKTCRYASRRPADEAIRPRLRELASERRRFGYRRLHILLRREGIKVNHKKL
ncbi:Transposase [Oceanibacterium hippocampi]|uniref:Transposase n=1 Tax=Oceanibacterium hippocampi TaxID=745714 RepID=A0A1Y5TVJ3_9PROT|nr:Transposase [Oceanibacterium hippocampi]